MKIKFISKTKLEKQDELKIRRLLERKGEKIFQFIEKRLNVNFKKQKYVCTLDENFPLGGISNPLTVKSKGKGLGGFITLLHELIHILMVENKEYFHKKFKPLNEKGINVSHAVIFKLLYEIGEKFFEGIDFSKLRKANRLNYPYAYELKDKEKFIKIYESLNKID